MITFTILLWGLVSARAAEAPSFREDTYATLREDSRRHGIVNVVDTEASIRTLADRLDQLHRFDPPFGLWLEDARPVVSVATAAMIWLRHLTQYDPEGDHAVEDRRLAAALAKLVSRAVDAERAPKDADRLRRHTERTFRHGLRVAKIVSAVDPGFKSLVALGQTQRLQRIFGHVADGLATACESRTLEL